MNTCRSCGAPILWAKTERGKMMPVDPDPSENGNVELVPRGTGFLAIVHGQAPLGAPPLHLPHHATCEFADEWRTRK